MVRHHQKEREPGWKRNIVINGVGSVATLIVLLIVGGHEVHERRVGAARGDPADHPVVQVDPPPLHDAWPRACASTPDYKPRQMNHTVVVLVGRRAPRRARGARVREVAATRTTCSRCRSSPTRRSRSGSSSSGRSSASTSRSRSSTRPYRELTRPVLRYIDELDARYDNDIITVRHPRVRGAATGGATCSTTRARCSSRAGCSSARAPW